MYTVFAQIAETGLIEKRWSHKQYRLSPTEMSEPYRVAFARLHRILAEGRLLGPSLDIPCPLLC